MAVNLAPCGNDAPFMDSSGNPLSGGQLFFYVGGSVGTLQNTYTTSAGNVANANPVVLDSGGYPAASGSVVEIWFTAGASYKAVLKTSAGVTVWTRDNLVGINDTTVTIDQWVAGPTPTYISATSFSLVGDQTSTFQVGRRVKTTNSGGTIYSRISASVYGALTTVTVVNDSGTLDAGLSAVSYGLLSATNPSFPAIIDGAGAVTVTYPAGRPTITVPAAITTTAPRLLENIGLAITLSANAAVIALKGADGNDPSASNVVGIGFRNATITTGTASKVSVTGALSTTISSGSTGGTVSAQASRIWVAGILVAGAVELAWYQSRTLTSIAPINESGLISTTAEGGAGGADSAATWYSTTARASVPFTILGCFDSTQTTAGTWAQAITSLNVNPRFRPGDTVQVQRTLDGAVATGTTVIPQDDTIPQITEGDQYLSQAITPTAAANVLKIQVYGSIYHSGGALQSSALFQDATANALAAVGHSFATVGGISALAHAMLAGTVSATTLRWRAGGTAAGTTTFNGNAGARIFGGVMASSITVEEVSA